MDKMKGLAKGGWHPAGDRQIKKETWKSDLKGMATGKKKDPYEEQRNHQSAPLSSLKDPDSFGPPPKHSAYYGANGVSRTNTGLSGTSSTVASVGGPSGGLGAPAVESGYAQRKRQQEEEDRKRMEQQQYEESTTRGPYQTDTTGLRTDNLPKPPLRRDASVNDPAARPSPTLPPRQNARPPPAMPPRQNAGPPPAMPPRQNTGPSPAPILPPRQNEYPDEHTPAPPPPYQEALKQPLAHIQAQARQSPQLNQGAMQRLGQAGVSVSGLGIGNSTSSNTTSPSLAQGASQVNELQQRFARMNTGAASPQARNMATAAIGSIGSMGTGAQKKPPPPPPKKTSLSAAMHARHQEAEASTRENVAPPPPVPMSSKPRPG